MPIATSPNRSRPLLFPKAPQVLVRPEIQIALRDGDGRVAALVQPVRGQMLVLRSRGKDARGSFAVGDVNATGGMNQRAPSSPATGALANLPLPQLLARFPLEAIGHAHVVHGIEIVAGNRGGADVHPADAIIEQVFGDVAGAAELEQIGAVDCQALDLQRRMVAIGAAGAGRPEFLASLRIVTLELMRQCEEKLVLLADANDDGRTPRTEKVLGRNSRVASRFVRLPDLLARVLVD